MDWSPLRINPGKQLFLIAGPCVIESRDNVRRVAQEVLAALDGLDISYIFKASYDKANRTSVNSFRGPGLEEGLGVLADLKKEFGLPVLSDVHDAQDAKSAGNTLDVLQIPAFLCRQTDLLVAAGNTGKVVNVKKGQFLAPWDMKHAVAKVKATGNDKVILTERGASFGYNTLISDMRSIPIMQHFEVPVVFDGTHSVQQPGGKGDKSGGQREFIPHLCRAAIAAGADGLFLETHFDPDNALSDGPNMLYTKDLRKLMQVCLDIFHRVRD